MRRLTRLRDKYSWIDKYTWVSAFTNGRAAVYLNNKYGHVDEDGRITTPIIYDNIGHFDGDRAGVSLNENWGKVDLNGKVVEGWHYLIRGAFND